MGRRIAERLVLACTAYVLYGVYCKSSCIEKKVSSRIERELVLERFFCRLAGRYECHQRDEADFLYGRKSKSAENMTFTLNRLLLALNSTPIKPL